MDLLPAAAMPSASAIALAGAAAAGASLLLAFGWHFIRDSTDDQGGRKGDAAWQKFVMETCGGSAFPKSLLSLGYLRSSATWLLRDARRILTRQKVVVEGGRWSDAPVARLEDGAPLRLFDFAPRVPGRPLVLNFGSWT
jgi:hypothetical protein